LSLPGNLTFGGVAAKDRVAMGKKLNPVWGLFLILVGFIAIVGVTNWLRGDEIVPDFRIGTPSQRSNS